MRIFWSLFILVIVIESCREKQQQRIDSFNEIDNSLAATRTILKPEVDLVYQEIKSSPETRPQVIAYTDTVFNSFHNIIIFLNGLKDSLHVIDSNGEATIPVEEMILKSPVGDSLVLKLDRFCTTLDSSPFVSRKQSLDSAVAVIKIARTQSDWRQNYFQGTPTIAAITILTAFEMYCTKATVIVLKDIQAHVVKSSKSEN